MSNASGTKVAFSERPRESAKGCLRATDWSLNDETLVVHGGDPTQINLLNIASRQQTPLVKHPDYNVLYGRLSPDNHWISFTARIRPDLGRIAVAPTDGPKPIPQSAWITIAEADLDDYANWSPDGKTLYFTSGRDGYSCLWGQRIDVISHQPAGEAFAVQRFDGRLSFDHGGWSAAAGRIAVLLVEKTGNLWMMSRSKTR